MRERSQEYNSSSYKKAYIAIPVPEGAVLDWIKRLNPHKSFFHITLFYLEGMNEKELGRVKMAVVSGSESLKNERIELERLDIIDNGQQVLALKVKVSDALEKTRKTIEEDLPEYEGSNFKFSPHITVQQPKPIWTPGAKQPFKPKAFNLQELEQISRFKDMSDYVSPIKPRIIGVYYRTDEDATALLFSQKI